MVERAPHAFSSAFQADRRDLRPHFAPLGKGDKCKKLQGHALCTRLRACSGVPALPLKELSQQKPSPVDKSSRLIHCDPENLSQSRWIR